MVQKCGAVDTELKSGNRKTPILLNLVPTGSILLASPGMVMKSTSEVAVSIHAVSPAENPASLKSVGAVAVAIVEPHRPINQSTNQPINQSTNQPIGTENDHQLIVIG